jgi:hypothetical protein
MRLGIKRWRQDAVGGQNKLGLLNEQRFLALEIITDYEIYGRGILT